MRKIAFLLISLAFAVIFYRLCYPARIIDIHHTSKHSIALVVEYFPWTKKGKIRWWEKHREEIFKQLKFNESIYSIYIYNTHYKKDSGTDQDSDLLCFDDMNTEANCISKENQPLVIHHYRDGHTEYQTENFFQRFLQHF